MAFTVYSHRKDFFLTPLEGWTHFRNKVTISIFLSSGMRVLAGLCARGDGHAVSSRLSVRGENKSKVQKGKSVSVN